MISLEFCCSWRLSACSTGDSFKLCFSAATDLQKAQHLPACLQHSLMESGSQKLMTRERIGPLFSLCPVKGPPSFMGYHLRHPLFVLCFLLNGNQLHKAHIQRDTYEYMCINMHIICVLTRVTYVYKAAFSFRGSPRYFLMKDYIWKL